MPPELTHNHSEAAPIIDAVERLARENEKERRARTMIDLPGGVKRLFHRNQHGCEVFEDFKEAPDRPHGALTVTTVAGFRHALDVLASENEKQPTLIRFRSGGSSGVRIEATLNAFTADHANYGDHRVVLAPPLAREWMRWIDFCRGAQDRRAAADFVADNIADFAEAAEGTSSHADLLAWLQRLSLKAVREINQADDSEDASVRLDGSATLTHVTRLALRIHEGGPAIGFRCRWRATLRDDRLVVYARLINADEAERRVWLGPVPDGAEWVPIVDAVRAAVEGIGEVIV